MRGGPAATCHIGDGCTHSGRLAYNRCTRKVAPHHTPKGTARPAQQAQGTYQRLAACSSSCCSHSRASGGAASALAPFHTSQSHPIQTHRLLDACSSSCCSRSRASACTAAASHRRSRPCMQRHMQHATGWLLARRRRRLNPSALLARVLRPADTLAELHVNWDVERTYVLRGASSSTRFPGIVRVGIAR